MGSRIFLFLFGGIFLSVGLWAASTMALIVADWSKAKTWEPVEAQVIEGDYKTHQDGENGSTYQAYGQYTYVYRGVAYKSTRVAIVNHADNFGDFHQELGRKLRAAASSRQPVTAYVDPENPTRSVINRELRLGVLGFWSIFFFVFGGPGVFIVYASPRKSRKKDPALHAGKPWLAKEEWQTPEIRSNSKMVIVFAWVFAFFWCLISAPILFIVQREVEKQNYPVLMGLLFPVIGVLLILKCLRLTAERKKFGDAVLTLDPFPGSIGGQTGGVIELNWPYDPGLRFEVTLANVYHYSTGHGKNRDRREDVKWQDKLIAASEPGLYGTRLSFRFDVPVGLNPSDADPETSSYYNWRIDITAEMEGVDFDRRYEIPVYATKQSSSARLASRALETAQEQTDTLAQEEAKAGIRLRFGSWGEEMFYPAGRLASTAILPVLTGVLFMGGGGFMWTKGPAVLGAIFFLIGGLCVLGSLYLCLNSLSVAGDGMGNVVTVRRVLGLAVKRRSVAIEDVGALVKTVGMSLSENGKQTRYFNIDGELKNGGQIRLGESFREERAANAAMEFIRARLRIRA